MLETAQPTKFEFMCRLYKHSYPFPFSQMKIYHGTKASKLLEICDFLERHLLSVIGKTYPSRLEVRKDTVSRG